MKVVIKEKKERTGYYTGQEVHVTKIENADKLETSLEYSHTLEYSPAFLYLTFKTREESFLEKFVLQDKIAFAYSHNGTVIKGSADLDRDSFIEYLYKLVDSSELTIERRRLYKTYDPEMKMASDTVLKDYELKFTNKEGMILTVFFVNLKDVELLDVEDDEK